MWLVLLVYLPIFLTNFLVAQDVGDSCVPNSHMPDGICQVVMECEPALIAIRNRRQHDFKRCGFSGIAEIVCCPRATSKFGTTDRPPRVSSRIADRECQKIIDNSITPLGLHIIGGEAASLGEFPHQVGLGYDRGRGFEFDCGGSIISPNFVLTASHCVDTLDRIEPTIIRAGVIEIGGRAWDPETDAGIAEIIRHPSYTRREKYHDLALIRLNKTLSFSSTLNAVCLETSQVNPRTPLVITGWGQTSNTRDLRSSILLKANVTFVDSDRCSVSYANWRKLPNGIAPEQLCAGDPAGLRDTCQGDSGGPLQSSDAQGNYRLVGITSFGRGCGSPVPGVYTRISSYLDWIESVVWPQ